MKTRIFSLLTVFFLTVLSMEVAQAQNPHFNNQNDPTVTISCVNGSYYVCASGTVYGVGDAHTGRLSYTYNASFNCYNRGNDPGPVPGQSGPVSGQTADVILTNVENGHADFNICFTISGSCKGNALASYVTGLTFTKLTLYVDGKEVRGSLARFVGQVPDCDPN